MNELSWDRALSASPGWGYRGCKGVLRAPGSQSSSQGLTQQMSLFTHQINTLPGSEGPLKKKLLQAGI